MKRVFVVFFLLLISVPSYAADKNQPPQSVINFVQVSKKPNAGDAIVQFNLGVMYINGQGVKQDYKVAYKWALLAEMNGKDVVKAKDWLKNRVTSAQIDEAQRLVKEISQKDGKTDAKPEHSSPYQLNEVDQPPRVLRAMMPRYPFEARQYGIQGRVTLRFVVDKDGRAQEPQVVSSEPGGVFEQSALDAVVNYEFRPAYKNGKPVDCFVKLPIVFTLNNNSIGGGQSVSPRIPKETEKAIEIAAYYNRDFANYNKDRFDRAINDLNKAIEINPDDPLGYDSRGFLYSVKSRFDRAINDFSRVIEICPENADGYSNRGIAYYYNGQYDKAISDYTRAIEINPEDAKAYAKRGDAFNEAGNLGRACSDWKKARDLGDNSRWSIRNIQRCAGKY